MAAQTGNIYISRTVRGGIEIPTKNLGFSTITCSKKVAPNVCELQQPPSYVAGRLSLSLSFGSTVFELIVVENVFRWNFDVVYHSSRDTCIHTNKFLTRPTCQFARESGALRWRQKQLWVARFKQFSFKPVLKCQKPISWTGVDTKRVPDCRSGCTKRSRCKWYKLFLFGQP